MMKDMLKPLLLAAALLVPGQLSANTLLLGGPPPVTNPNPTIPAPASAAGFTTQNWFADFTTSIGTNFIKGGVGSTVNWATLSNWLTECGGPGSPSFHWSDFGGGPGSCSNVDIETDPSIGKPVLHIHDTASRGIMFPYVGFGAGTGLGSNILPLEYYYEVTWRASSTTMNQTPAIDIIQSFASVGGSHSHWFEPDNWEVFNGTRGSNGWHYGDGTTEYDCTTSTNTSGFCPGTIGDTAVVANLFTDETVYHKYGVLFTSDGSTQLWKCAYLDDKLQGCDEATPTQGAAATTLEFNNKDYVFGMFMNFAQASPLPADVYIQNIQLWGCANSYLTSTQCPGPIINLPPH